MVEAVLRGFTRGEEEFGVVARVILCCIRFPAHPPHNGDDDDDDDIVFVVVVVDLYKMIRCTTR